ncbi:MAG TPA: LysM peptidoglycan-binding domain-containing protein [Spirochaetota bacterium]|nr:LysM peptidoglycan-binding domain-containing protein [Spirochaetota bacterium]
MKYRNLAAILSFITLFLLACQDEIPINELSKAKLAIDRALTVKADEYAPEEFNEANKQISVAHEQIIKEEKPEECIKNADAAYNKAVEAYNKSAVLYAEAGMRKAEEAIAAADDAYAEKLSPDNFREAKDLHASASQRYEAKNYEETISLAKASYDKAVKAREEALDNKYQLQVKIDEVSSRISRIEQYDYEAYAPGQYNLAVENLKKAQEEYNDDRIREGFQSVAIADKNADEAYKLTMEGVTGAKIIEAEDAVKAAENSNGAATAAEDMDAAREALANAKLSRDNGNYDDSITYSNEAIRLSNDVIESGKKAAVVAAGDGKDKVQDDKTTKSANGEVIKEDENYYYYKVKSWAKYGDCLWQIAGEFYGNPRLWTKIYKANKNKISNPDLIRPGWVLKIPKIQK